MIKKGLIISTENIKNKKIYNIKIDNSEITKYCAIKLSDCGSNKCPGGCSSCSNEKGLFANNTDIITASNDTNKEFKIGDSVLVETKHTFFQAILSIFLPFTLGFILSVILYLFLKTEKAVISGFFGGMFLTICLILLYMPSNKYKYPKIICKVEE